MLLDLTPDELLATTRSVRKRLDLTRPVEREVLEECLRLAQRPPTASYAQNWHFVVVTDPERRAALGELCEASPAHTWSGGCPRPPPTGVSPASLRQSDIWPTTSTRCRST